MKKKILLWLLLILSIVFIINLKAKNHYVENDNIIGIYVDSKLQEIIPKKGEAVFSKVICDNNDVNYYWDNDSWGLFVANLSKKAKCNLYFVSYSGQTVFDFDYTGAEQTFASPVSGIYKLEAWGAEGGGNQQNMGGKGGYSTGTVYINKDDILFLNIGGKGSVSLDELGDNAVGGYNGGGNGKNSHNLCSNHIAGSGGGASHISTKTGLLSQLQDFKENILIAAGGGGGGNFCNLANYGTGGSGGGFIGMNPTNLGPDSTSNHYGTGGTQIKAGCRSSGDSYCGTFGIGFSSNDSIWGVGAGGGYYGGGSSTINGAGGGSGYIGNSLLTNKVMYCYNCEESSEENTKTISTTCAEETPTSNCSKKGNGYARITLVSIDE